LTVASFIAPADAASVSFEVTGNITAADNFASFGFNPVSVGDDFTFRYTYDTSATPTDVDFPTGDGAVYTDAPGISDDIFRDVSVRVGNNLLVDPTVTSATVLDQTNDIAFPIESYGVAASFVEEFTTPDSPGSSVLATVQLSNIGPSRPKLLSDTSLPDSVAPQFYDSNIPEFFLGYSDEDQLIGTISGDVTLVTSSQGPPIDPPTNPDPTTDPGGPDVPDMPDVPDTPDLPDPPVITAGFTEDDPILPDEITDDGVFVFRGIPTDRWVDPPVAEGFTYEMLSEDTTFIAVTDFPGGFLDPFEIVVDGEVLGQFEPGDSYTFADGGVESFNIENINPGVETGDADAFPLRIAFSDDFADLRMTPILAELSDGPIDSGNPGDPQAIPTPAAFAGGLMLMLGLAGRRRSAA
jgi:hypothetical protein